MKKNVSEISFLKPLEVKVTSSFEDAMRKFKMLVQKEKIVATYKERMSYEKPSDRQRRKSREAAARQFTAELREKQILNGEWAKRQKLKEQKRQAKIEKRKQSNTQESE